MQRTWRRLGICDFRGDPDPALADPDGSRSDPGYTGGPYAPDW